MAEIKSFPNNQDVYVGAEWVMKWLHGRTSGVFGAENNLAASAVPDSMSVEVSDGVGWLANANGDGIVFWNDSEQSGGSKLRLTHDVADGALDRIDRIVVTWETTNYVALPTISILKGIASSTPVPPVLTNNTTQRQISIASVKIPAGAISLSASMVTDERLDPDVCGIVTETIKVDTSTMQNQFEALLSAIQNELQELNAGTAALLKTGDTMQGTLDMGGNKITNVATPTDENDAVPKKILDAALNGKLSMELLWKNASPTSSFSAQTISLDLSEFDFVFISCFVSNYGGGTEKESHFALKGEKNALYSQGSVFSSRSVTVSATGLTFTNGVARPTYGSWTSNTDNHGIVPDKIYGIKGVS